MNESEVMVGQCARVTQLAFSNDSFANSINILVRVQIGISQQNFRKIRLGDRIMSFAEFMEFQFQHLALQILHKLLKALEFQLVTSALAKKMDSQCCVHNVSALQSL